MKPKENNLLIETITLNGCEGRLQTDWSHIWDAENSLLVDDDDDNEVKMLCCWSKYLADLPKTDQPDEKWQPILDVVIAENDLAAVWRRLLIAAISAPDFYAQRIWTLLLNPGILLSLQYSGQFLKRDAMPTASNAYGIQQRSKKSECNLNPK